MKVYFTASLRGKGDFEANYELIADSIKELGYVMVSNHVFENDSASVVSQSKIEASVSYRQLLGGIKKADVFVAEVSTQSLSVGHEITQAINLGKPVVLLYVGDRRPTMLFGSGYSKLQMIQYDEKNCRQPLEKALEEAKKGIDVRFNFFVSPKILSYLDWVAKTKKLPRAVFLRNLIEREMKKDKAFRE